MAFCKPKKSGRLEPKKHFLAGGTHFCTRLTKDIQKKKKFFLHKFQKAPKVKFSTFFFF
jgi:hypothetical protein